MDIMPFYLVFLQSMPETAILVSLGLILIGVKPRLIPVLLVALITAFASYIIRALPLPPGINIFLQLPIMIILLAYMQKINIAFALTASFLGLICITLTEIVFNSCVTFITGITLQDAVGNPFWRVLFPLPEFIFLIILILVLNYYSKSILNLPEFYEMTQVKKYEER